MKSDTTPFFVTDLLLAGSLLTRLPLPHLPDAAFARSPRAVWAYPLAGALLGALAGAVGAIAVLVGLPSIVAAGLVLISLTMCSGAMHEDGLADTADGLWGGSTAEKRLAIMKDSHIGTYGTLALILVTGLRWTAYAALLPVGIGGVVAAAVLSRAAMPVLMIALPHARNFGLSHSVGKPNPLSVCVGLFLAIGIAVMCLGIQALLAVCAVASMTIAMGILAKRKIKGQTGDILGATQQITETAVLFSVLISLQ